MSVLNQILSNKIIAIVRGARPEDMLKIAGALYEGGIRILEVTMNSAQPLTVIEELTGRFGTQLTVGAGTVLDGEVAKKAVAAGASFLLSPIVDTTLIKTAKELGVVNIPGAYTATEIYHAYKHGADIVKVFPASSPSYIKDIAGPLPQVPLLPTGGITLENIREFKKAGAAGFGIGSALVDTRQEVSTAYLSQLTERARRFTEAVNS